MFSSSSSRVLIAASASRLVPSGGVPITALRMPGAL
jgi:hypothetical protein